MEDKISTGEYILDALSRGMGKNQIQSELLHKGYEESFVNELLQETVKTYRIKMRAKGLWLILSGAVICFTSFLLTITSPFTHFSFPFVLYGLTSFGIIIVFLGLMKIF
jgi:hypothetical protein